ncbi:M23 family metallopeptidase [Streptomyces syringium]|uniref:M23 family metallopeptidase n=1 Tax=Streptomyces syringium TaxID=76729 RepID=UPI003F5481A5
MASNKPAPGDGSYESYGPYGSYEQPEPSELYGAYAPEPSIVPAYMTPLTPAAEPAVAAPPTVNPMAAAEPAGESGEVWNPTAESVAPVRGRHRVVKQRGGTMARSGAVLGVGVIAAVGAGGMATAQDRPAAPISVPDVAQSIPGFGALLADDDDKKKDAASGPAAAQAPGADQPLTQAGLSAEEAARGTSDAGEALRARILQQAEHQQNLGDEEAREAEAKKAAEAHRKAAAEKAEQAAAEKEKAEAEAAAEKKKAEAEKAAEKAAEKSSNESSDESSSESGGGGSESSGGGSGHSSGSYSLPVGSYTLTAGFGQAGDMWSANHTGADFAAPTGTPVKAVGGGTITSAGWAGAYGYRVVLTLNDGTQIWYCHLSSMVVTSGQVSAGDVIGRVGATGNVTGPHLHLETRPGGGSPVDPLSWLRGRGLQP